MIIIGLTGSIASGKTTILNFIKKQNIPVYDSDECVSNLYKKPTARFINYLKKISLAKAIKKNKIEKQIIRNEVFYNKEKLKYLEKFIHHQTKLSRDRFLKKNLLTKKEMVALDIPLLFEKKLENTCDYVFLAYSPIKIRLSRVLKRRNMNKNIFKKINDLQTPHNIKKTKSDFVINTSISKAYSNKKTLKAIKTIRDLNKL